MSRSGKLCNPLQSSVTSKHGGSPQRQPKVPAVQGFPGQFVGVDSDVKFLQDQDVDGVHLLIDLDKCSEIHVLLGNYAHGPTNFFPAMWHVTLSKINIFYLESNPYVVAPKPVGPRFFLYLDPSGTIYLENMTQQIFRIDDHHAIKMCSFDGRPIVNTVLDGIVTREKSKKSENKNAETENKGRLTFVIQDAIRCRGTDLTNLNIVERIAFIQEEIMKPRDYAFKNGTTSDYADEAFNLDIVELKDTCFAEEFLSTGFEENFKYPLRAFVFYPRHMGYKSEKCESVLQWAENDPQLCSFQLKIRPGNRSKQADLMVVGRFRKYQVYDTIAVTDEIRELDGQIIDCDYVDHQWIFKEVRHDRKHPNGRKAVDGKMETLQNPVTRHLLLSSLEKSKGRD